MSVSFLRLGAVSASVLLGLAASVVLLVSSSQADPPGAEPPPVPLGVEVLARGPVHEAFASPTHEPEPTKCVPKAPPPALEEMPPDQKPEGEVIWITGYWAWDDDRNDYMWVSGIWRTPPPNKRWVPGYWRGENGQHQWVGGFWTDTGKAGSEEEQEVTYLPAPPAPPEVAPPGEAPDPDTFYVPGHYVWGGPGYVWKAGYWARVQPDHVWVAAHYRWSPSGYIYVAGYWDYVPARRGVLFAPVYVDRAVVGASFVYSPAYVVTDTVVVDSLFVRPCHCHYYFGDYYGPTYRSWGFESCVVYSSRHYDCVIIHERYVHRSEPAWLSVQINIHSDRHEGRAPLPPRTLVQQTTIVQNNVTINKTVVNNTVIAPVSKMSEVKNVKTVPLDQTARTQVKSQAQTVQAAAATRQKSEVAVPTGTPIQPRTAKLAAPQPKTIGAGGVMTPVSGPAKTAAVTSGVPKTGPAGNPTPGLTKTPGADLQKTTAGMPKVTSPPGVSTPGGTKTTPGQLTSKPGGTVTPGMQPKVTAPPPTNKVAPPPTNKAPAAKPPAKAPPSKDKEKKKHD